MKWTVWLGLIAILFAPSLSAAVSDMLLATATVNGSGNLNHQPLNGFGVSLGSGDRLETGANSGAIVTISDTDMLILGENSAVTLVSRPDGVGAELDRGRVQVTTKQQRLREVRLAGETISVRTVPGSATHYQISRLSDATYILPDHGALSVYRDGSSDPIEVPQGMTSVVGPSGRVWQLAQLSPGSSPQQPSAPGNGGAAAGGQQAGKLSVTIPADFIIRGTAQVEGSAGDVLFLNDLLRTGPRGRVRFTMNDGSILTIGSNTQIRVLEHNAQSQRTSIEMLYGRVRSQVVKLTAPNSVFEIRTATAICGALGTDYFVEAGPKSTRVVVFQGKVRVTPLLGGAAGAILLSAGQTAVSTGSSASSPATATASQVQSSITATTATQAAAQAGVAGGLAGSASSATSTVAIVASALIPPAAVAAVTVPALTQNVVSPIIPSLQQ